MPFKNALMPQSRPLAPALLSVAPIIPVKTRILTPFFKFSPTGVHPSDVYLKIHNTKTLFDRPNYFPVVDNIGIYPPTYTQVQKKP